jgi:D-sedoheptulose 7-phosphate isomerase
MHNGEYVERFLTGVTQVAETIDRESIDRAIEMLFAAWRRGSTVFICGNGGSASTSTHMAADLFKCTIVDKQPRVRVISLVDNIPLMSALTNDDGWHNVYIEQLKTLFRPGDVVLAISVHGGSGRDKAGLWSQNLLKAIEYAKQNGGHTLGFSGFDGGALKELADVCVVVPYNTTPHVEAFHVVLHHLVTFCLAEKIREYAGEEKGRAQAAGGVS